MIDLFYMSNSLEKKQKYLSVCYYLIKVTTAEPIVHKLFIAILYMTPGKDCGPSKFNNFAQEKSKYLLFFLMHQRKNPRKGALSKSLLFLEFFDSKLKKTLTV